MRDPVRGLTVMSHPTDNSYVHHGEDDEILEFRYIVTQTEDEGPEYEEFRQIGNKNPDGTITIGVPNSEYPGKLPDWERWDDKLNGTVPQGVIEHFLG
jgi:hypothetical protein